MLKKFLLISMLCIGVTVIMVQQARAGCCCNPRFCASWLKGSLDSYHTAVVRNYPADCTEEDCPKTQAQAFGTILPDSPGADSCYKGFDPNNPNPDCSMPAVAFCNNPANKKPRNFPGGTAVPYYFSGFASTDLQELDCNKNGNCKLLLQLDLTTGVNVCKDNWVVADFAAQEFIGVQDMCPGGYDLNGDCCATDERDDGDCAEQNLGIINADLSATKPGEPTRYVKYCYHDLTNYQFGDSFTYCCQYCVLDTNGNYDCSDAHDLVHAGICIQE